MAISDIKEFTHLSEADVAAIGREFDAIRRDVEASRGEDDAAYIRGVIALQRRLEIGGRVALVGSILPPLWLAGTAALAASKIIENMEIGHNVMHGQWDWMNDPEIHSADVGVGQRLPLGAVEALPQLPAPHVYERHRQGQGRRLRDPAGLAPTSRGTRTTWGSRSTTPC